MAPGLFVLFGALIGAASAIGGVVFLLRHLKPERYAAAAPAEPREAEVEACLRAMEPQLPAPPDQLLEPEALAHELDVADAGDGKLPHFHSEQRPPKTAARIEAEARAAQDARGKAAWEKSQRKEGELTREEFTDMCRYLDPASRAEKSRKRYR
jgi:hypothetical protein